MLRSLLRASALTSPQFLRASAIPSIHPSTQNDIHLCFYASKAAKTAKKPDPKSKVKSKSKSKSKTEADTEGAAGLSELDMAVSDDGATRARLLAEDAKDSSLDVGLNGRPLFTSTPSLALLTRKDTCSYFKFSEDGLNAVLPEGLPKGMVTEFEESMRRALLVRQSFLDLRDNFRRIVDPPLSSSDGKGSKARKQIVLDGPVSCGKSITLAMLVHWARDEGWLVFYVPRGREWAHGGFFYKNPQTGLWDTPLQAENVLKDFLKYNEPRLKLLPCHVFDPIPLGEGAGVGWPKVDDSVSIPEGSMLYDLVQIGIRSTYAAVGVVVRLRKELALVKDVPVLIAIDQYNNWFTFSEFQEPVTVRSCRPIHARELAMVNAFRSMMHNGMMVGAFSHSTAVGKLRKDLPDVPVDARIFLPRYTLDEAASVCHYYLRQRLVRREAFSEENWRKIYYLSNGNGAEMRSLIPLMR
ncbi:28S ribosomal protein S29 mitochondrial [Tripterygium wilfordii]|uniref:Small ribosomal subunit protein mS29 n=1 Tax=Tripterygium wilfordii TaxID=458696 RepID=A0A7J7BZF9_TRIWF|nr:28S ribosomal protein S29, mitochondrial [Tripterygium wilfordii]KAF5727300.1 28S ribosomal protein S29 mitochondrial [Tripterygium wilfordii]